MLRFFPLQMKNQRKEYLVSFPATKYTSISVLNFISQPAYSLYKFCIHINVKLGSTFSLILTAINRAYAESFIFLLLISMVKVSLFLNFLPQNRFWERIFIRTMLKCAEHVSWFKH